MDCMACELSLEKTDFQIMMLEMIGKFGGKNQIVFLTVPLKIHILWIKNLNIKIENIRKNYWKMLMILGARKILLKKIQILKNLKVIHLTVSVLKTSVKQ